VNAWNIGRAKKTWYSTSRTISRMSICRKYDPVPHYSCNSPRLIFLNMAIGITVTSVSTVRTQTFLQHFCPASSIGHMKEKVHVCFLMETGNKLLQSWSAREHNTLFLLVALCTFLPQFHAWLHQWGAKLYQLAKNTKWPIDNGRIFLCRWAILPLLPNMEQTTALRPDKQFT